VPIFVAWLYRAVPVVVGLVVLGIIVYVVLYNSRGSQAAKNIFARIFWWICLVGTVLFGIIALYAWGEHNTNLAEFFAICAGTIALFWGLDVLFGYLMRRRDRERRIANMARPESGPSQDSNE
jgi:cytochrome bd-type quinol oxidase subunit 2